MLPPHPRLPRDRCLIVATIAFALWGALGPTARAHDTFFRVADVRVAPGERVEVHVFHGTFDESVLRIGADHPKTLRLHGPVEAIDTGLSTWEQRGYGNRVWQRWHRLRAWMGDLDERMTSRFYLTAPADGSYMLAMALHPAGAALAPDVFNKYLREIGLGDEPVARHGITDPNAIITERYIKYVKLLLQVGRTHTANVTEPTGLDVEFVPLSHPLDTRPGGVLPFRLYFEGKPLANQPVIVGRPRPGFGAEPIPHRKLRSDADGRIEVAIDASGGWWLSFVHLAPTAPGDDCAWESKWATLTFEIL